MSTTLVSPLMPRHVGAFAGTQYSIYAGNTGQGLPMHQHADQHTHACMVGSTEIRKEGKVIAMTPLSPPVILAANEPHEVVCTSDNTVFEHLGIYGAVQNFY